MYTLQKESLALTVTSTAFLCPYAMVHDFLYMWTTHTDIQQSAYMEKV